MAFKFPFSTLHELNLDWILSKVKELVENNEEFNDKADYAVQTADEAKQIAEDAAGSVLADGSVTTPKIADYAVTQVKLAVNSVGNYQLQNASVTNDKLANECVDKENVYYTNTTLIENDVDNIIDNVWNTIVHWFAGLKIVYFSIVVTMDSSATPHTIFTMPNNYFTETSYEVPVIGLNTGASVVFKVDYNGDVTIKNLTGSAITNETYVATIVCY